MKHLLFAALLPLTTFASAATLTLTPGQTGTLGDRQVTLLRAQDSRCPINAICVRPGELTLSVLVTRAGHAQFLKIQWPEARNEPTGPAGVRVTEVPGRQDGSREPLRVTFSDDAR